MTIVNTKEGRVIYTKDGPALSIKLVQVGGQFFIRGTADGNLVDQDVGTNFLGALQAWKDACDGLGLVKLVVEPEPQVEPEFQSDQPFEVAARKKKERSEVARKAWATRKKNQAKAEAETQVAVEAKSRKKFGAKLLGSRQHMEVRHQASSKFGITDVNDEVAVADGMSAPKYYASLVCKNGKSNKFWEVRTSDFWLYRHWGRTGTHGQVKIKPCGGSSAAVRKARKLVQEKLQKGYEIKPGTKAGNI